jgi:hypothetical protein
MLCLLYLSFFFLEYFGGPKWWWGYLYVSVQRFYLIAKLGGMSKKKSTFSTEYNIDYNINEAAVIAAQRSSGNDIKKECDEDIAYEK